LKEQSKNRSFFTSRKKALQETAGKRGKKQTEEEVK
jgi:hypothetical protein